MVSMARRISVTGLRLGDTRTIQLVFIMGLVFIKAKMIVIVYLNVLVGSVETAS